MKRRDFLIGSCFAPIILSFPAGAEEGRQTLSVVTSLPKELSSAFKAAFEKKNPNITVEVQQRGTQAAVTFLRETKSKSPTDIFWASAPDAFEVLKAEGLLEKFTPNETGVPAKIGEYPINDPEGYYVGFALSGAAIMWNSRYIRANRLPQVKSWDELALAPLFDHVAMAMPSRSGSTHLTLETMLQARGWNSGWALIKSICGNMRLITERSYGVPDGVTSGQFGYGVVLDYQALASRGAGFPIEFVHPSDTTIVPSNIGVVKNGPNAAAARQFIEFMLSEEGQDLLFKPSVGRLPVRPASYKQAPAGTPNPFEIKWGATGGFKFNVDMSEKRYAVVDALFDQTITFQLDALKGVVKTIHKVEAKLADRKNPDAAALIAQARNAIAQMPFDEQQAAAKEFTDAFHGSTKTKEGARQDELEQQWASFARDNYAKAQQLANKAEELAI
jgi:phosphoglycerate transport regulatory protein PgtC